MNFKFGQAHYNDKKLRNMIFYLNKVEKIARVSSGDQKGKIKGGIPMVTSIINLVVAITEWLNKIKSIVFRLTVEVEVKDKKDQKDK